MTPRAQRKPSFFWQGLLILLPVALMAAIGLAAILRDRAAVEREAQQRAGEILRQLAPDISRRVAAQLAEFDLAVDDWRLYGWPWPSSPNHRAEIPGLDPAQVFPNRISFAADEVMPSSPDDIQPPVPPPWFVGLSDDQRQAWDTIQEAQLAHKRSSEVETTIRRFLDLHPPTDAVANAEFVRFNHRSMATNWTALDSLRFAVTHRSVRTESGLPLSNLAIAQALNPGPSSSMGSDRSPLGWGVEAVLDESVRAPSFLMPELMDKARILIAGRAGWLNAFEALRQAYQRLARVAWAVQQSGCLHISTNLWVTAGHDRWFCSLTTANGTTNELGQSGVGSSNRGSLTNEATELRVYPQAFLERAFAHAARETKLLIPGYFGLTAELAGVPLNCISRQAPQPGVPHVLAEIQDRLILPIEFTGANEPLGHSLPVRYGDVSWVNNLPLFPKLIFAHPNPAAGPRFTLQLSLVDPAQLFARQQQRTLLFGGLILASALAALVGLATARRAFYRQLRLSELKSDFVSSVSHELRSPIASVRLMAESLERGKIAEVSKRQEYFRFIGQECRRLSSLIENVLDFSRIEQGRKQYEFEPTDLAALAQQTVKLMETYASERQVKLAVFIPEAQLAILATQPRVDGKAIQQALVNLIDNAMKHSPKGETVTIGVEVQSPKSKVQGQKSKVRSSKFEVESRKSGAADRGCIFMWVEDHGEGIPAVEHERIFERFYRRGSELRRETQGVGIGLSLVKHITEAHGGRVRVRSAPGQGSRFTMELPLWNES